MAGGASMSGADASRDAVLREILRDAGTMGWPAAARHHDATHFFPGGVRDMLDAYADFADRRMIGQARPAMAAPSLTARVRALAAARIVAAEPERPALRRAALYLALPQNQCFRARLHARSVDRLWREAGDKSADFSWYTKRAILGAILTASFLRSLAEDEGSVQTLAFLDRRLAGVGKFGKFKAGLRRRSPSKGG
jgi:ubiquinone biosynthesis protein COQ9